MSTQPESAPRRRPLADLAASMYPHRGATLDPRTRGLDDLSSARARVKAAQKLV